MSTPDSSRCWIVNTCPSNSYCKIEITMNYLFFSSAELWCFLFISVTVFGQEKAVKTDETPVQVLRASGKLTDSKRPVLFDIGKQQFGQPVPVELEIVNNFGHDLNLELTPNCGCMKLAKRHVEIRKDASLRLIAKVNIPNEKQDIRVVIDCFDKELGRSFVIGIVGTAVPFVEAKPNVAMLRSESSGLEIELIENFPNVHIADVKLFSDDAFQLLSREKNKLSLVTRQKLQGDYDPIVFSVKASNGKEQFVTIPVEVIGAVRLGPSVVSLRKFEDHYRVILLVHGLEKSIDKDDLIVELGDGETWDISGKVVTNKARTERGAVLFAAFNSKEVENLFGGVEKQPQAILVRVKNRDQGWCCATKVSCSLE